MADINRDMDSYMRRRKSSGPFSLRSFGGESWWSGLFSGNTQGGKHNSKQNPKEDEELMAMEQDLKAREETIEHAQELEHELEEQQEREVSLYHRLRKFFSREGQEPSEEDAAFAAAEAAEAARVAMNTPDVQNDFRELAQIQMRWLSRMPTRMMTEFKESEDFVKLTAILERRGVAKKKTE